MSDMSSEPRFLTLRRQVAEIVSSPSGDGDRDVMVCNSDMSSTRRLEVGS